jgi:hypothetical protein
MRHNDWPVARWGAYALILLYAGYYFGDIAAPGNRPQYPLGWWGWWDQSQYIASSRGLLTGHLAPDAHWYPPGYSVLAVPFVWLWPMHGFFFLDLFCVLAAYGGFLGFARCIGLGRSIAVSIFLLTTFADPRIAQVWAEPWTSTPNAALIWGILACAANLMRGESEWRNWRLGLLGLCSAAAPLVRPTDAALSATAVLYVLIVRWRQRQLHLSHIIWLVLGGAAATLPFSALYVSIYGLHLSPYMLHEREIGFAFSQLGWKAYLLLVEPRPWYPLEQGLLVSFPWLVISLTELCLLVVARRNETGRPALILLALMIVVHWTLYFAYVDLLPSNIWRYHVVHYLKWTLPGLGLLCWLFLRRVWQSPQWQYGLLVVLVVGALAIRVVPIPAGPDDDADMLRYTASPPPGWDDTYLQDWAFSDALGPLGRLGVRVLPDSQGVRVLPTRRSIVGALSWPGQPAGIRGPTERWKARVTMGYPCWLPPYPCRWLLPRP